MRFDRHPTVLMSLRLQVKALMGVGETQAFSKDILNLTISGPDEGHFSIIDVPGLFKRHEEGHTTKDDIKTVDEMVKGYMANARSIILMVVPCNGDIANQEIVELAETYDLNGIRTLGILTKPDLMDEGTESEIMDIMLGRKHVLKLGWHILRNPGQAQLDMTSWIDTRADEEERFFTDTAPWNDLPATRVGVEALQSRLQIILAKHIRREFPKVSSNEKSVVVRMMLTTLARYSGRSVSNWQKRDNSFRNLGVPGRLARSKLNT